MIGFKSTDKNKGQKQEWPGGLSMLVLGKLDVGET